jgi:hypothetical protein
MLVVECWVAAVYSCLVVCADFSKGNGHQELIVLWIDCRGKLSSQSLTL